MSDDKPDSYTITFTREDIKRILAEAARARPQADIHVHGAAHKAVVKTTGRIEATLHRWPKMSEMA
jgi:imidazolonepropionase-like amidohydrolase